jgi:hypothetical protein
MRLQVGPFHRQAKRPLTPNSPQQPLWVVSEHFVGRINIYVKSKYQLHIVTDKVDDYFANKSRLFSFQIQGRFAQEWPGDDLEFGVFLDQPLSNFPFGSSLAIAFIQVGSHFQRACQWKKNYSQRK